MAGESSDSVARSALQDIANIAASTVDAPVASAPQTRSKSTGFIDNAGSLLADIQLSVEADAAAEVARLEAERQAAEAAEQQRILETRSLEAAQMQARIAAERARRQYAEEERLAKLKAQDIAERRARGEIIEEDEPEPDPQVVAAAQAAAAAAAQAAAQAAAAPVPAAPPKRGAGFYAAVVTGVLAVCGTAIAVAIILKPDPPPPPPPVDPTPAGVSIGNTVPSAPATIAPAYVPEEEPDAGVEDAEVPDAEVKVAKKPTQKGKGKGGGTKPTTPEKTPASKGGLKLNLGGGGDLTF